MKTCREPAAEARPRFFLSLSIWCLINTSKMYKSQEVGPRLGVAAMWQVVLFLTLMTRIILINTDNVIQIRENQRNQCFFIVRGKFSRPLALCRPSPCPHATSKPTTLILILNI